jgi:hypothetical protein
VIFPNPVTGEFTHIRINVKNPTDTVDVKVFTIAFRKVIDAQTQVPTGVYQLDLHDKNGTFLANGLYYIVVTTPQARFVQKLLILR